MSTSLTAAVLLKQARDARGWSQEELARRAGIRVESISRTETGRRPLGEKLRICLGRAFAAAPRDGDPADANAWYDALAGA